MKWQYKINQRYGTITEATAVLTYPMAVYSATYRYSFFYSYATYVIFVHYN